MTDTPHESNVGASGSLALYLHEKAGEVLFAARALIADKSRWTHGAMARRKAPETDLGANSLGISVGANSPDAVCWCALGAIVKTADALVPYERPVHPQQLVLRIRVADMAIQLLRYDGSIATLNDDEGHAAVLKVFDAALAEYKGV